MPKTGHAVQPSRGSARWFCRSVYPLLFQPSRGGRARFTGRQTGNCSAGLCPAGVNCESGLRGTRSGDASGRVASLHRSGHGRGCAVRNINVMSWIALLRDICNTIGQIQMIFQTCEMKPRSAAGSSATGPALDSGFALFIPADRAAGLVVQAFFVCIRVVLMF